MAVVVQLYGLYSPVSPGPPGVPGLDKVGHLAAFGVPALLARLLDARWLVVALVVHALVSEPVQGWLQPTREPALLDAVANLVGAALGVALARALLARSGRMDG